MKKKSYLIFLSIFVYFPVIKYFDRFILKLDEPLKIKMVQSFCINQTRKLFEVLQYKSLFNQRLQGNHNQNFVVLSDCLVSAINNFPQQTITRICWRLANWATGRCQIWFVFEMSNWLYRWKLVGCCTEITIYTTLFVE